MNQYNIFDSYAWIILASGCFMGGVLVGGTLHSILASYFPKRNEADPDDVWQKRYEGFNK